MIRNTDIAQAMQRPLQMAIESGNTNSAECIQILMQAIALESEDALVCPMQNTWREEIRPLHHINQMQNLANLANQILSQDA